MYLGITCDLTQPIGILGVGGGGAITEGSCENCKSSEWVASWWAILPSGRKYCIYYIIIIMKKKYNIYL